jgi:hypothetical protein
MQNIRLVAALAAGAMVAVPAIAAGDWKDRFAGKVIGEVVEEGIEDAVEDAALDAALDVAVGSAVAAVAPGVSDRGDVRDIGDNVVDGVETAMRVADVADTLDDVADTIENINRLRRWVR